MCHYWVRLLGLNKTISKSIFSFGRTKYLLILRGQHTTPTTTMHYTCLVNLLGIDFDGGKRDYRHTHAHTRHTCVTTETPITSLARAIIERWFVFPPPPRYLMFLIGSLRDRWHIDRRREREREREGV